MLGWEVLLAESGIRGISLAEYGILVFRIRNAAQEKLEFQNQRLAWIPLYGTTRKS